MKGTLLVGLGLAAAGPSGCNGGMRGTWSGTCDFEAEDYEYDADVEITITDGRRHDLDGTGRLSMWDERLLEGDANGDRNGDYVTFEVIIPEANSEWIFRVDGEFDGPTVEGTCSLSVPNGVGGLQGAIVLEQ